MPSARRIDGFRKLVEREVVGPEGLGRVAGHDPRPILIVAHPPSRHEAVEHEHDVLLVVGVVGVPHRHRHHPQRRLKFLERSRFAHAEPLLEHLRTIEPGHAHRDCHAVLVEDDRPMDAAPDVETLFAQRAIGSLHLQRARLALERPQRAVEDILIVPER